MQKMRLDNLWTGTQATLDYFRHVFKNYWSEGGAHHCRCSACHIIGGEAYLWLVLWRVSWCLKTSYYRAYKRIGVAKHQGSPQLPTQRSPECHLSFKSFNVANRLHPSSQRFCPSLSYLFQASLSAALVASRVRNPQSRYRNRWPAL